MLSPVAPERNSLFQSLSRLLNQDYQNYLKKSTLVIDKSILRTYSVQECTLIVPMNSKTRLLQQDRKIFSTDDLALIWNVTNRNTLKTTIRRYLANGTLFKIRRGLYSTLPIEDLDPYLLGTSYIKGFCYVSLQTILERHGAINQTVDKITLLGNRSKEFEVDNNSYICRKIKPEYLNNREDIIFQDGYATASLERAVADILYLSPKFHLDSPDLVDWTKVEEIQNKVFK